MVKRYIIQPIKNYNYFFYFNGNVNALEKNEFSQRNVTKINATFSCKKRFFIFNPQKYVIRFFVTPPIWWHKDHISVYNPVIYNPRKEMCK